jgi:hypothetical protein
VRERFLGAIKIRFKSPLSNTYLRGLFSFSGSGGESGALRFLHIAGPFLPAEAPFALAAVSPLYYGINTWQQRG